MIRPWGSRIDVADDRYYRYTVLIDREMLDELDRWAEAEGGASTASVLRRMLATGMRVERAELLDRARRRTESGR
jgi:hypothetical protein